MATWIIEPGHTGIEFKARHMMITWVRGHIKDVHGVLEFDWDRCLDTTFKGEIDTGKIDTGEPTRDAHLKSSDFFDVENHPKATFEGRFTERLGRNAFKGEVDLTIRGVTKTVPLDISYEGEWETPFWVDGENKGILRRIGFHADAKVNRFEFDVAWQDELPNGGVVVSSEIDLALDLEAIHREDLERTGAIEYYVAN